MTHDARQHLLDQLANGAPDCVLRELLMRAETAGLSATPRDIDTRGLSPAKSQRVLREMLRRAGEQMKRDTEVLCREGLPCD